MNGVENQPQPDALAENVRAVLRLIFPEHITPIGKRQIERVLDEHTKPVKNERGAIAIMTAFLMVVLLIMAGFTIDFGQAYVNKRQMQTAADAAALAAASIYADYSGDCPTLQSNATARVEAQARADEYREQNASGATGDSITIACVDGALQVTTNSTRRTTSLFGSLTGTGSSIAVERTATASMSVSPRLPGGLRPLALCLAQLPNPAVTGQVVRIDYPGDGHKVFPGCPDSSASGNWWTLDCPGERTGSTSAGLEVEIKEGCPDPVSIVTPQNATNAVTLSTSLTAACPSAPLHSETCLEGDPGQMDAGHIEDSWRYLVDHQITVVLPVFCAPPTCLPTTLTGTGTNAVFPVYKLASMRVCGYHFSKTAKYEFFDGDCVNHGTLSTIGDTTKDNYLLVTFKSVLTSGGTEDYDCDLDSQCDGGLRRVLLVN